MGRLLGLSAFGAGFWLAQYRAPVKVVAPPVPKALSKEFCESLWALPEASRE